MPPIASLVVFAVSVLSASAMPLPGAAPIGMDYLAIDRAHHRVWVPAGNTGKVDVIDTETGKITSVSGLATAPSSPPGRPAMGPSSATVGDGVVWIGNRADKRVCAFDAVSLVAGPCATLSSMPDGIAYVSSTHELWVTTPKTHSVTVVSTPSLTQTTIALPGSPEGYAVDDEHGVFYTNLEDKDKTLALEIKSHKVVGTYQPGCGEKGPRGLALDGKRRLLVVACTDGAVALDAASHGKSLGRIKTGAGVDNIDFLPVRNLVYLASGSDGTLTIAELDAYGLISPVATATTAPGARNAVVDAAGTAYVADSRGGKIIMVKFPR